MMGLREFIKFNDIRSREIGRKAMRKDIVFASLILAVALIIGAWMLTGQDMAVAAAGESGKYEIVAIGDNPIVVFRLNETTGKIDAFRVDTIDLQDISQSDK